MSRLGSLLKKILAGFVLVVLSIYVLTNSRETISEGLQFSRTLDIRLRPSPGHCGSNLSLLIISHPSNRALRDAHRRALPRGILSQLGTDRIFVLAEALEEKGRYTKVEQWVIEQEWRAHEDILQVAVTEDYRHLTYKHLAALQWASIECLHSKWLLKLDDDIGVDIFQLLEVLESADPLNSLYGNVIDSALPKRNPSSKWFVSKAEYAMDKYPPFLSGWAYATTPVTAGQLLNVSKSRSTFWIDDVYITGILTAAIEAKLIPLNGLFTTVASQLHCCQADHQHWCDYAAGPVDGNADLLRNFLSQTALCHSRGCKHLTQEERSLVPCVTSKQMRGTLGRGEGEVIPIRL